MDALFYDKDVVIWRNNSGAVKVEPTLFSKSRMVRYGLTTGASDLIGIVKCRPGLDRIFGRFLALEVKVGKSSPTAQQQEFIRKVLEMGGYACVVRSIDDALAAVEQAKEL